MRWNENQVKILIENYELKGPDFCSTLLNVDKRKVIVKANYIGLKTKYKIKTENKNKPKINYILFDEKFTKESVYILGLLWADGYINKNRTTSISCIENDMLNVKDIFKKTGDWQISERIKKHFNGHEVKSQIKISTTTWGLYDILRKFNYHNKSKSSPDLLLEKIPEYLKKYWFRGYMDGDGCIRLGKNRGMSVVFTSSYEQDWEFLISLTKKLNISYTINKNITKQGKSSQFLIHRKNDVKKILDFIYIDFDDIGFKRKYEKYLKILIYINLKSKHFWSENDKKFLIDNYRVIGGEKCSEILNKKLSSIYNKIRLIKI